MPYISKLKKVVKTLLGRTPLELKSAEAYDLWASTYDTQTDNLIVQIGDIAFASLLNRIDLGQKMLVDVGCGTGRHWPLLKEKGVARIVGYEVSAEMLNKLLEKYPDARTHLSKDNMLRELADESCDVIISTLVIGYIKDLEKVFAEWDRVLKKGGDVIITDFHPDSVAKGATRSFNHQGQHILIENFLHPLEEVGLLASKRGWKKMEFVEKSIDEEVKQFFEERGMMGNYEKIFGAKVVYGWRFGK